MTLPRLNRFPITSGMVGDDQNERNRQVAELNHQLDEIYSLLHTIVGAGGEVAAADGPFVLHGDTVPASLSGSELHRNMSGDNLHWPKVHAERHASLGGTGGDVFLSTHIIDASIRNVYTTTGGGTTLPVLGIGDGEYLKRDAGNITSAPLGGVAGLDWAANETPTGSINGANVTFTLGNTPSPANTLMLFLNGVLQLYGTDFTLATATITMTLAPFTGDWLRAYYWH